MVFWVVSTKVWSFVESLCTLAGNGAGKKVSRFENIIGRLKLRLKLGNLLPEYRIKGN